MWPNTYWLNTNKNSPVQDWDGLGIISCAKMSKKVWRKITLKDTTVQYVKCQTAGLCQAPNKYTVTLFFIWHANLVVGNCSLPLPIERENHATKNSKASCTY